MRKNVCASLARKEIRQGLLLGPASLAAGLLIVYFGGFFSGPFLTVLDNLGKNFVYIFVSLFLILCGAYLLFQGLQGLFDLKSTDVCRAIRSQLRPEEEHLTAKEMLALVDQDLVYARRCAGGKVLLGQEWLAVPHASGQLVIRLENIRRIDRRGKDSTGLYLKFADGQGRGPCTRELTQVEADAIEFDVKSRMADLEGRPPV